MSHFYQPDDDTWEGRMDSYIEESEKQITALRAAHEAELRRTQSLETALARMEALKKRLEQWRKHMRHVVTEEELAEVDALLAACERKEG